MYLEDRRKTITEVEEITNLIYRQSGRKKLSKDRKAKKSKEEPINTLKKEEGRKRP
jgi:hypothetical protein